MELCLSLLLSLLAVTTKVEAELSTITLDALARPGTNSSLEYHLCTASEELVSDTLMILSPGTHYIDQGDPCIIVGISNLTIRGNDQELTRISCTSNVLGRNFIFLNVTALRIENILVHNCGREIPSNLPAEVNGTYTYIGPKQKGVFLFHRVTDLLLERLVITQCYGFGITGINLRGDAVLRNVSIVDTDNYRHILCGGFVVGIVPDFSCSGSGAAFIYSDPIDPNEPTPANTSLTIADSVFEYNQNFIPLDRFLKVYINVRSTFETEQFPSTGAQALAVFMSARSYHVSVDVTGCSIQKNNGYSAAVVVLYYNMIREATVRFSNTIFANNVARDVGRGGGIILLMVTYVDSLHSYPSYPDDIHDVMIVTECLFMNNNAFQGGGVYIHPSPQNISDYRITFDRTTFIENSATVGSAFVASSIQTTFQTNSVHILLQDVQAHNNTFPENIFSTSSTIDTSAVFVFVLIRNATFTGRLETHGGKFFNNSPGVILTSGGNVYLRGNLHFNDNLAFRGGGVSLYDYSLLFFHEGSQIRFVNNRAIQSGGAIYATSLGTGISDTCVLQVIGPNRVFGTRNLTQLDLSITFVNNTAGEAGNSIYANPVYNCAYLPEASIVQDQIIFSEAEVYNSIFTFDSLKKNGRNELSSEPNRLCFCNQTEFNINFCLGEPYGMKTNISTLPGKKFSVMVIPVDLASSTVSSLLFSELDDTKFKLGPAQGTQRIPGDNCTAVDFNIYGKENATVNLNMFTKLGGQAVILEVTIKSCPPGFTLDVQDELQQCVCDAYIKTNIGTTCNMTTFTIIRPGNSWLGKIIHVNASDVVYVPTCPVDHCRTNVTEIDLTVVDQLCEPGRSGVLCGKCNEQLSIAFGSNQCRKCSHYWLFTIFLYIVVGVLLVLLLFVFDLTVAVGTINGLIFYANVISVNANIFYQDGRSGFLFIFFSLLNLELGFPLCFYDGMTEAAKVGFQFIFPAYLLILCAGIILLARLSSTIQKLTACNGVHVLGTLLYVCYAKILRTVIDILSFATLNSEVEGHTVWLFDGNIGYFTRAHIPLVIAAVIALLFFLIPYTVPMVLIKKIQQHSIRFKPLADAYSAPYKDNYRHWFGLRLLLLAAMCGTYAIAGTNFPSLALMIQLLLIAWFSLWQAYRKPFRNTYLQLLDLFYMVNFISLAIGTLYFLSIQSSNAGARLRGGVIFFLSLALIVFLGILIFHVFHILYRIPVLKAKMGKCLEKIREMATYQKLKEYKQRLLRKFEDGETKAATNAVSLTNFNDSNGKTIPTVTVVSFDNSLRLPDDDIRRTSQTASFSELREPVLDHAH